MFFVTFLFPRFCRAVYRAAYRAEWQNYNLYLFSNRCRLRSRFRHRFFRSRQSCFRQLFSLRPASNRYRGLCGDISCKVAESLES